MTLLATPAPGRAGVCSVQGGAAAWAFKAAALLLAALLSVAGCSKSFVQSEWQCPLFQGKGCLSISRADATALPGSESVEMIPIAAALSPPGAAGGGGGVASAPGAETGLRSPETLARIWVAAFVDAENIYHEAGYIHVVVTPAHWTGGAEPPAVGDEPRLTP